MCILPDAAGLRYLNEQPKLQPSRRPSAILGLRKQNECYGHGGAVVGDVELVAADSGSPVGSRKPFA